MRRILWLLWLILTGCTSSDPYTWRDMASDLSVSYCTGLDTCGFPQASDCAEVALADECDKSDCSAELDADRATSAWLACDEAIALLDSAGCAELGAGHWPSGCDAALRFEP